jgi:hypothetical protein
LSSASDPLVTIFSAPKPFTNPHIALIQGNAVQSWLHLGPQAEVLLVGDEPGLPEAAAAAGVRLLPDVRRNAAGTPLLSSIFALARQASRAPILIYVNGDILLLPDVLEAALRAADQRRSQGFLLVGQRWDLDVRQPLSFDGDWAGRLRQEARARGRLHAPSGSDYFVFPRHLFQDLPDFAVGRAGWDNWMIYHARQQGWLVVDGTPSVTVIHQDHDYSHLPGGKAHYTLPESRQNETLAGGSANLYMVLDSDVQLVNGELRRPPLTLVRALRLAELRLTPPDGARRGWRWSLARRFRRLRRRLTGSGKFAASDDAGC